MSFFETENSKDCPAGAAIEDEPVAVNTTFSPKYTFSDVYAAFKVAYNWSFN